MYHHVQPLIHEFNHLVPLKGLSCGTKRYALHAPPFDALQYAAVNIRVQPKIIGVDQQAGATIVAVHARLILAHSGAYVAVKPGWSQGNCRRTRYGNCIPGDQVHNHERRPRADLLEDQQRVAAQDSKRGKHATAKEKDGGNKIRKTSYDAIPVQQLPREVASAEQE